MLDSGHRFVAYIRSYIIHKNGIKKTLKDRFVHMPLPMPSTLNWTVRSPKVYDRRKRRWMSHERCNGQHPQRTPTRVVTFLLGVFTPYSLTLISLLKTVWVANASSGARHAYPFPNHLVSTLIFSDPYVYFLSPFALDVLWAAHSRLINLFALRSHMTINISART